MLLLDKSIPTLYTPERMSEPIPPSFRSAFHGNGAAAYSSSKSQREFSKSLLRLSNRLYWAGFAAVLVSAFTARVDGYLLCLVVACLASFVGATYSRHYALIIIDYLEENRPKRHGVKKPKPQSNETPA